MRINGSIVLYNNNRGQLKRAINSFLDTDLAVKLYLIDNSETNDLKNLADIDLNRIEYIFNNENLGFGKAHNVALVKSIEENATYHLVLNPDVYYERNVLESLINYMNSHADVGNILPQVRYPDGEIQYLCRLLPTPIDLIFRRFIPSEKLKSKINNRYELRWTGYNHIMNIPNLSGCFMFLRTKAVEEVGMFDENFFMYLEDFDLNRRIHEKYKTIFYPEVEIIHEYERESYKNKKLLKHHIQSAFYYFNKWGWFFDEKRKWMNRKTVADLLNTIGSFDK